MPRCQICSRPLSLLEALRSYFRRSPVVYPFVSIAGNHEEQQVRWACGRCVQRSLRRRQDASWARPPEEEPGPSG